jgi:hypothetical protein
MAAFLAVQCLARGARFVTIERSLDVVQHRDLIEKLGAELMELDLFGAEASGKIAALFASLPRPAVLFCDDGDKPREVREFGPLLLESDYLAVHDWGGEIFAADIPDEFVPVLGGECEATASLTRFYRRVC